MSHTATAWAFGVRNLSSDQRVVLIYLADCHCPETGCFSDPEGVAAWAEIEHSQALSVLKELEYLRLARIPVNFADRIILGCDLDFGNEVAR